MITFSGGLILLDVEGTVSPLAFVHEVMFPYARTEARSFLEANFARSEVVAALQQMALDAGKPSLAEWCPAPFPSGAAFAWIMQEIHALMGVDAKLTGLKQLQGLIWEQGFQAGELRSTLFDDVAVALGQWSRAGKQMRIYSSGSVHAQRLFFAHTESGDLTRYLSGYYDTTMGPKREASSYAAIAKDAGYPCQEILFLSDVAAELDAARDSGMQTCLIMRPGNQETESHGHPSCSVFEQIRLESQP